jgi:predicted amidohydrolase YtcJ
VTDILFRGGTVWTGERAGARAQALRVRDGKVFASGSEDEVRAAARSGAQTVELEGRTLLPGFIDAHTHFLMGGAKLSSVNLRDAATPTEFTRRMRDFAAKLRPGEWITGGDWNHELWGGTLPDSSWIDAVTPNNPVLVSRLDAHMALANRAALALGGVTRDTPDPAGGTIVRDAKGEPTGVLKDTAMAFVSRTIPEPTDGDLERALAAATRHAFSLGVTQVHDMGPLLGRSWRHLETYQRARQAGSLEPRVYCAVPLETWEEMVRYAKEQGKGDDRLWWGSLKGFVDGSLGSTTAWFNEPYSDSPDTVGLTVTEPPVLRERVLGADAAGMHVIVHAIGDRANDWLLDVYEEAAQEHGPRDRRFRTEHAQHLTPAAIARFGRQGVIPSMQPYHAVDDGPWAGKRLGPERVRRSYAVRSLLDSGAPVAFGSDWTVAPLNPLPTLTAAITRQTAGGGNPGGWIPEQKITLEEALVAHTHGSAVAGYSDRFSGTLRPGAYADLVILSGDLFATPAEEIASMQADVTYVEGKEVFRRE